MVSASTGSVAPERKSSMPVASSAERAPAMEAAPIVVAPCSEPLPSRSAKVVVLATPLSSVQVTT